MTTAMLPVQLTGFVGREQELATVSRLLDTSRLLTLTGAGGSGKTRLALAAVASRAAGGTGEVVWVELAALTDAESLPMHVALALGVRADGGVSAERAMLAMLRDRELLLVLDNCEHLVDECARLVQQLLQQCPGVSVLATSREALGIGGERSWLVPALSLPFDRASPTPSEAQQSEAVRLFVARVQDVLPSFTLTEGNVDAVVQICRRLDGLPLAVELAAARVNVLTPHQIAERLDDRFGLLTVSSRTVLPRHRTLRAAVDWSYDLLAEPERVLLERLSVFAGGFTLDAAEQICCCSVISGSDVLDLLAALTSRSLVSMQEDDGRARYRLLETIREYAAARRAARGDDQRLGTIHAGYFLAMAEAAVPELILGRRDRLRQMDVELENIRTALTWSVEQQAGATTGLPLCWAMMWYWFHRQSWREGFRHFEAALATAVDPAPELRAAALHAMGLFGLYAADPESRARLLEAESLWRAVGNTRWLTFTLLVRATESSLRRSPEEARECAEAAVAVAHTVGDEWYVALAVAHALVPALLWAGQWADAASALAESERVYRARQYDIGVAYVLDARAFATLQLGDISGAVRLAHASLTHAPDRENRWLAGRSLRILGAIAMMRGQLVRAVQLYAAADALYEAIGARSLTQERHEVNAGPTQLRTMMAADTFDEAWQVGRRLSLADAVALALDASIAGDLQEPVDVSSAEISDAAAAQTLTVDAVADAAPPLTVRSLGHLEIHRDGELLPAEAFRYARPREMLLYLLAHPEGRTREQIGLDFWPEISAAQVKNNFHVTLHHLRKAIGRSELIRYDRDRYRVAFDGGVWFDAAEFEPAVRGALSRLKQRDAGASVADELTAALSLYRGAFLETESAGDWHLALRDRLSLLHAQGLRALAGLREAAGEHTAAAAAYQRLLEADSLDEDAVRRLMIAMARDGRRGDALRQFDRFRTELARELEAEPEPDTTQLADRIRQGDAIRVHS